MLADGLSWIGNLCVAMATIGCVYALIAAALTLRFSRRAMPSDAAEPLPSVTVLKPLCGREPGLLARLLAFGHQHYGAPVQVVFGTQNRADPAIDVVERLRAAGPDADIDIAIDPLGHGTNRKVSNLINMAPLARHDVIALSDSDIEVGPTYLRDVTAELAKPGVGAVTCLYHGIAGAGFWSRLSAMSINSYFLPNVVVARSVGLAQPCFGATIALRRETLDDIGGFHAFADCLADDYAIGAAVRAAGYDVIIPPFSVGHVCFEQTAGELLRHQMRQSCTIRSIDPVGYAGAIITHPFALALIGAFLGSSLGLLVAAAAVVCRTLLTIAVERSFDLPRQPYWLVPFRDLIAFTTFVSGFFGTTVSWRGSRYRVLSDGSVVQESN
ncbi:MAG TPA: bacteriohopanetetrol glucosamine biosynthesis glycosyltransferase HpnI [Xanthobacteraceae bacterium]|nr:bacteriohopanetetrol glucosamine biosynthesis glycosyltransferase HpnI [Xanthobacteraceae bacterium]